MFHFLGAADCTLAPYGKPDFWMFDKAERVPYHTEEFAGVIACFRNEAVEGKKISDAKYVQAQVIYRDAHGAEVGDVPYACWLGQQGHKVDLLLGESHCVLLAAYIEGQLRVPCKRLEGTEWGGHVAFTDERKFNDVAGIELKIIGDGKEPLLPPILFSLFIENDQPRISVRQAPMGFLVS